ncbi:hypothetical protein [Aquisphaera insulae]|uniref:hypothetical protein n=1 Tax=Aquisphaera insulae TaxID=2712864 RepID=UPI0013EBA6B1|nr:hypothetical protein [Aquisphaera insulae]
MMTPAATQAPGRTARLLAVLSIACFWLLPFSPLVAIGAVSKTRATSGWPRRLALAGAFLCIAYTILLALLFLRALIELRG